MKGKIIYKKVLAPLFFLLLIINNSNADTDYYPGTWQNDNGVHTYFENEQLDIVATDMGIHLVDYRLDVTTGGLSHSYWLLGYDGTEHKGTYAFDMTGGGYRDIRITAYGGNIYVFTVNFWIGKIEGKKGIFSFDSFGHPDVSWVDIPALDYNVFGNSQLKDAKADDRGIHLIWENGYNIESHTSTEVCYARYRFSSSSWVDPKVVTDQPGIGAYGYLPTLVTKPDRVTVFFLRNEYNAQLDEITSRIISRELIVGGSWQAPVEVHNYVAAYDQNDPVSKFIDLDVVIFNNKIHLVSPFFYYDDQVSAPYINKVDYLTRDIGSSTWQYDEKFFIANHDGYINERGLALVAGSDYPYVFYPFYSGGVNQNQYEIQAFHIDPNGHWSLEKTNLNSNLTESGLNSVACVNNQGIHVLWGSMVSSTPPNGIIYYTRKALSIPADENGISSITEMNNFWTFQTHIGADNSSTPEFDEITIPSGKIVWMDENDNLRLYGNHLIVEGTLHLYPSNVSWIGNSGEIICDGGTIITHGSGSINIENNIQVNSGSKFEIGENLVLNFINGSELIVNGGEVECGNNSKISFENNQNKFEIYPGSTLKFGENAELEINCLLSAQGSAIEPILFTSQITEPTESQKWNGITLTSQADLASIIQNTIIENAEYGINISNNDLNIANNVIQNNTYGIYSISGDLSVQNNLISNNTTGMYLLSTEFDIYKNTITGNDHNGIYLSNSSLGEISGNQIYSNSDMLIQEFPVAAIYLYNSSPSIFNNQIYSNDRNGILLQNNSFPNILENNLISENGPAFPNPSMYEQAEILISDLSNPFMDFGHNDIVDETGFLMIHTSEPENPIMVRGNYWDEDPELRLYPEEFYNYDRWDEEPNTFGIPEQLDQAEQLFLIAATEEEQGNFSVAKTTYQQVVTSYPDSVEATYALSRIFKCEDALKGDFIQLKNYYQNLAQNFTDSGKVKISDHFTRRCVIKQMQFNDAIVAYEGIVQNPPSLADSIYALIDIGETYLLQEEFSSGNSQNLKIGTTGGAASTPTNSALKPQSIKEFEANKARLLNKLYKKDVVNLNNNLPTNFHLYQNYPNPFNPKTTITFSIEKRQKIELSIYSITGELIQTLTNRYYNKGIHHIEWNSVDNRGDSVSSGIYVYQIITENHQVAKKMILMK